MACVLGRPQSTEVRCVRWSRRSCPATLVLGFVQRCDDSARSCIVEAHVQQCVTQLLRSGHVEVNNRVESGERRSQVVVAAGRWVKDSGVELRRVGADRVVVASHRCRCVAFGVPLDRRVSHGLINHNVRKQVACEKAMCQRGVLHRSNGADRVGVHVQARPGRTAVCADRPRVA